MAKKKLKAPFPYFGGKSMVAGMVWELLGDVDNYIEPFCGSAAALLGRPTLPRVETVNDADCYLANFWRATQQAPDKVAEYADWPVNEADLHARHRWLVLSEPAAFFKHKMRTDPDYFDPRFAGWWVWGACCWIGSGWCSSGAEVEKLPRLTNDVALLSATSQQAPRLKAAGQGVNVKRSALSGDNPGSRGKGVHAQGELPDGRRPRAHRPSTQGRKKSTGLTGVIGEPSERLPSISSSVGIHADAGESVLAQKMPFARPGGDAARTDGHRPQLGDAYSRGRGIHGNDEAGTCEQRRAWLVDWFSRLRDRLRTVRVCCGDWLRVCDSPSVTTRLGTTGIFFDPPYAHSVRNADLYGVESATVSADVRAYCLERGSDPMMRIVLAGYEGEGHEKLESAGWTVRAWRAQGGYGNRGGNNENAAKERLWVSPHCLATDGPLIEMMGA